MIGRSFVVVFLLYIGTHFVKAQLQLNICPVQGELVKHLFTGKDLTFTFNLSTLGLNRTIQPGYPLNQCFLFFEGGACCQRHEEQALFNMFQELRFTGSDTCEALMSNLLCYICSPDQANWYSNNQVRLQNKLSCGLTL